MLKRLKRFRKLIFVLIGAVLGLLYTSLLASDPATQLAGDGADLGGGGIVGEERNPPVSVVIPNASFEQGVDAPSSWMAFAEDTSEHYIWDSNIYWAGSRSVSIRNTAYAYGRWLSESIAVEQSGYQWYTLEGKVTTHGNNGEVYLAIAWLTQDGIMIQTSDTPMLAEGENEWSTLTVSALPPANASSLSVWCISNHNDGQAWFDDVQLTRTGFTASGVVSYTQFVTEYPSDVLAVEANVMQVRELMTHAKWIKEGDFYNTDVQLSASKLYAEAASVERNDTVYTSVFTVLHTDELERAAALSAAQSRFDTLIDESLRKAIDTADAGNDAAKVAQYLETLEARRAAAETNTSQEFQE